MLEVEGNLQASHDKVARMTEYGMDPEAALLEYACQLSSLVISSIADTYNRVLCSINREQLSVTDLFWELSTGLSS